MKKAIPLITIKVSPIKESNPNSLIKKENVKINYQLNKESVNYLKNLTSRVRVITLGGGCQSGKKTCMNTLPFILKRIPSIKKETEDSGGTFTDYHRINSLSDELHVKSNEEIDQIFPTTHFHGSKREKEFSILLEEIVIPNFGPCLLIKAECLNATINCVAKDTKEEVEKCIDKLYSLFYFISDIFIFNIDCLGKSAVENKRLIQKFFNLCKFVEKKKQNKKVIKSVELENVFIFCRNKSNINVEEMFGSVLTNINRSKPYRDWIFPISEIPKDFRLNPLCEYIGESDYEKDIIQALETMTANYKIDTGENKSKTLPVYNFHIDRLNLYINIFNEEKTDVFGNIIQLETHLNALENKIAEKLSEIEKCSAILNIYNYFFYRNEIVEEVVQQYIQEEIKKEEMISKIHEVIVKVPDEEKKKEIIDKIIKKEEGKDKFPEIQHKEVEGSNNANVFKKEAESVDPIESLRRMNSKRGLLGSASEEIEDLISFHNRKVMNVEEVIKSDGTVGKLINLDNGESYLVYKNETTGEVSTLEPPEISGKWDVMNKDSSSAVKSGKKVTDVYKDYSKGDSGKVGSSVDKYSKYSSEEISSQGNILSREFGLGAVSAGSAIIGSIIANWLTGQYKDVPWSQVFKRELVLTGGLSMAVTGITIKIPWIGLAVAASVLGMESLSTLSKEAINAQTKSEILVKNSSQLAVGLGAGAGFTYIGGAFGSAIPVVGTLLGALGGMIAGSLLGGFAGTYLSYKINNLWRILDPQKVLQVLQESITSDGSWVNISDICIQLKLKPEFIKSKIPNQLFDDPAANFAPVNIIWANFIFINVITFIAAYKPELQEDCGKLFEKGVKFLKQEDKVAKDIINKNNNTNTKLANIDNVVKIKVKYYKYIGNLKEVLENWISLMT